MILPNYQEEKREMTKSSVDFFLIFDKIKVQLTGYAKSPKTKIIFYLKENEKKHEVLLNPYLMAVKDYCLSHPYIAQYGKQSPNLFDSSCIKEITFKNLSFHYNEFETIKKCFPSLEKVETKNGTICKNVSLGILTCDYYDFNSNIYSLDNLNGFAGSVLYLDKTHFLRQNKQFLTFQNQVLTLKQVNIPYETFFLTTNAPSLRKIKIEGKTLKDKELLFIAGFYNLESIEIKALLTNYQMLEKLEKLREIKNILITHKNELEKVKKSRPSEHLNYLMHQRMFRQNEYLDFFQKLYVPRLEQVNWQQKIEQKTKEQIKEELLQLASLSRKERKSIPRKQKEITWFDRRHGLVFDDKEEPKEVEEYLVNSDPFGINGFDYYVRKRKIIIEE